MTRFVFAAFLLAAIGPAAIAQPVKPPDPIPKPKEPSPTVIQVPVVKPPIGYYKTGGVLVGADGYYPFDTGEWILSGDAGMARTKGTFVMVSPNGEVMHNTLPLHAAPYPIPVYPRHSLFHRRW